MLNKIVEELIANMWEDDTPDNLTYIGLLIEKKVYNPGDEKTYRDFLPSQYHDIVLSDLDVDYIVDRLIEYIDSSQPYTDTAAWALSKAESKKATHYLIKTLNERWVNEANLAKQVLLGLDASEFSESKSLLKNISASNREEIAAIASGILRRI